MRWRRTPSAAVLLAAALSLSPLSTARAASPGQPAADRGAALYRSGDLRGARAAFQEAVRLDPGLANAWHSLGWVEHRLGNGAEALRIWRDLLRLHPGRADTREAIAALEREQERRETASARAAEVPPSAEAPPSAEPPGATGYADPVDRADAGDPAAEAAEPPAAIARELEPAPGAPARGRDAARLATDRGAAEFAERRFDAAADAFGDALSRDPANRLALRGLGWAHRRAGRLDAAEAAWTAYARAYPALAEPHDLLAALHLDRRAWDAALAEARASLAIDPTAKGARLRHIRSLFGLGRIGEARQAAAALAADAPGDPQAQRALAAALTKSRDFEGAARQWRHVLDLDPGSGVAMQNWVRALHEGGAADAAVAAARELAARPDAPAGVLELLAEDGRARQDPEEAARWYRELTRRFPEQVRSWRNLLQELDALGRFEEQVATARAAVRRHPAHSELQLDLSTALGNAGRLAEAVELTRRFLDEHPDSRAAFEALVDLLRRSGAIAEALALVSRNRSSFYKDYEKAMVEASLRARRNELPTAERLLRSIADAGPGRRFVPILLYHGVVAHPRTLQISAAAFEDQMAALASRGYHAITLTELARMLAGEEPFPARPILITFDDARTDSFRAADPILARYGFKATMFVPTANIRVDDAFHAGWDTIRAFAATGRWDMQAHGHEAHTPVAIDARGDVGDFLVYRAWLPAEGRGERPAEFLARVDADYRASRRELEEHLPGSAVLGYAYPLNQVAYAQPEDRDVLSGVNERVPARYFRFGLVQDESGYNDLRPGEEAPFMLRRYEVPGSWGGEQLLAHLARNEPARAARLELARLALEEGRPRAARRLLEEIVREEPLVAPQAEAALAYVAAEEQRPREAAAHLAASPPPSPGALAQADSLRNRLAWRNDPRAGAESSAFGDSDGRSAVRAGAALRRPLAGELDLSLEAGRIWLSDRGQPTLAGPQVTGGVSGAVGRRLGVESWARLRRLSSEPWGVNGGLSLRLREERHQLELRWRYEDVETVRAALEGVQRHQVSLGYAFGAPGWDADASASRYAFDDGNDRTDLHARVLRTFGADGRWALGGSLDLEDSRSAPAEYYAPQRLAIAMGRLRYGHRWADASSLSIDAGLGVARDAPHGARPSGLVGVRFSRWWGARARISTGIGVEARALPGYQSISATLRLEGRL